MRIKIALFVCCALLACLPASSQWEPPPDSFVIQNASQLLAFIDDDGNLELRGYIFDNASNSDLDTSGTEQNDFIVQNSNGAIQARLTPDGDLFLRNEALENGVWCSTVTYPHVAFNKNRREGLIIRDSTASNVGWIDERGNLLVNGSIIENATGAGPSVAGDNVHIRIWSPFIILGEPVTNLWYQNFDPEVEIWVNGVRLGGTSFLLPDGVNDEPLDFYVHFDWGAAVNEIEVRYVSGVLHQWILQSCCDPAEPTHLTWDRATFEMEVTTLRDDDATFLEMYCAQCTLKEEIDGNTEYLIAYIVSSEADEEAQIGISTELVFDQKIDDSVVPMFSVNTDYLISCP